MTRSRRRSRQRVAGIILRSARKNKYHVRYEYDGVSHRTICHKNALKILKTPDEPVSFTDVSSSSSEEEEEEIAPTHNDIAAINAIDSAINLSLSPIQATDSASAGTLPSPDSGLNTSIDYENTMETGGGVSIENDVNMEIETDTHLDENRDRNVTIEEDEQEHVPIRDNTAGIPVDYGAKLANAREKVKKLEGKKTTRKSGRETITWEVIENHDCNYGDMEIDKESLGMKEEERFHESDPHFVAKTFLKMMFKDWELTWCTLNRCIVRNNDPRIREFTKKEFLVAFGLLIGASSWTKKVKDLW